ncbi:MAG: TrmH family RNA methyltransferase [Sphingomicrobium sp.]
MTFWTYVLRCSDGSYYSGHSDDLERRMGEHESGLTPGYTQRRRPVTLMWSQEFPGREEALAAELQIKNWSRGKKEALFRSDWETVSNLAKPPGRRSRLDVSSKIEARPRDAKPIIVLIRPQLGQNIGKAARAMLNFGLTELRLVAPRDGWPNPDAGPSASGADIVLERATLFDTVEAAIADCAHVYASTVRRRELVMPVITPTQMGGELASVAGRSAILFGPERSGLETEEVALAHKIVTVPINPKFGSLNLAQAVILLAYEWSRHAELAQPPAREAEALAPHADVDGMIAQLDGLLVDKGYFHPPERMQATRNTIRTIFTKTGWSGREVKAVRGIIRALANPARKRR